MRLPILSLAAVLATAGPVLANGQMKQSPLLFHKAGAACAHVRAHRGPQAGAGYGYRLGGCLPRGR